MRYGEPTEERPLGRREKCPEYDVCLKEFLSSGAEYWKVNLETMPSDNIRTIISSLKWRTHKLEFVNIKVFMRNFQVYLQRIQDDKDQM